MYVNIFPTDPNNPFTSRLAACIATNIEVSSATITRRELISLSLSPRKAQSLVVLNWIENSFARQAGKVPRLLGYLGIILLIRLWGGKVVWVRHNEIPHRLNEQGDNFYSVACRFLSQVVTKEIPMFDAKTSEILLHPFPSVSTYGYDAPKRYDAGIVGYLAPYKNILETVNEFSKSQSGCRLLLLGRFSDPNYRSAVLEAGGDSIVLVEGNFSDEEIEWYVRRCRYLISANRDGSSYVSGNVFLGLALGTPVLALEAPYYRSLLGRYCGTGLYLSRDITSLISDLADDVHQANAASFLRISDSDVGRDWLDKIGEGYRLGC